MKDKRNHIRAQNRKNQQALRARRLKQQVVQVQVYAHEGDKAKLKRYAKELLEKRGIVL